MRPIRLIGFFGVLVSIVSSHTSVALAQQLTTESLRTNMRIRVRQAGGETGTGLFLGILGDTLFYESSTMLPRNVVSGGSFAHATVKVPVSMITRLDVRVQPEPPIAPDRCVGVLRGAGCGARIAVNDIPTGQSNSSSNNGYDGIADAVAVTGLVIGGAVVGLIKSVKRHAEKNDDFGWRQVRLAKPQTR